MQNQVPRPVITIVVAISTNNAIGKNNQLLWHLPNDLKHFKQVTSGKTVIMGRKTFDSIGKPLPNRRNIVVTRQHITIDGCEVVNSLEEALKLGANENDLHIVGGAEIYRQALPVTDRIFLTIVHHEFEADSYFPSLNMNDWKETERQDYKPDDKHQFPYSFITLERH